MVQTRKPLTDMLSSLKNNPRLLIGSTLGFSIIIILIVVFFMQNRLSGLQGTNMTLSQKLSATEKKLQALQNEDQVKVNKDLREEIEHINKTYKRAVSLYEALVGFSDEGNKTADYEELLAESLSYLSDRKYASADATLTKLQTAFDKEKKQIATSVALPKNVPVNNVPPSGGYNTQQVKTEIGTYLVDIISADMGSTRVVVDTASENDCSNDCPVLSVGDYATRSGAYAAINGAYFCPAAYPSCAGKTNSFDTLLMNKNKHYFNSDNNVYSTVPAAIFLGGSIRYVGQSLEWGRDTGVDGVIANQPLLLSGGEIAFGGNSDPKQGSKGARSFIGSKGSIVYIGVVHNATVAEVAYVLKALGLEGALNLDSGGSTALWYNGRYIQGPGRNIPDAILFLRK